MTSYIDMFRGERVKYTRFDGKVFTALIVEVDGPLEDGQPPSFAKLFVLEAPLHFEDGVPYDSRGSAGSFDFIGEPLAAKHGPSTEAKLDSNNDELLRLGDMERRELDRKLSNEAINKARAEAAELQQRLNEENFSSAALGEGDLKRETPKSSESKAAIAGKSDAAKVAESGAENTARPGKAVP